MKPDILVVEDVSTALAIEPELDDGFTVHVLPETGDRDEVLAHVGGRVRAIVTTTNKGADGRLIGALPRLELIANAGGHLDRIDLAAARARGIPVTHTPGVSTADVADFVFALLLAVARRISEGDRFVRARRWRSGMMGFGTRVNGKKLGIVGLGAIGRTVAKRAGGFRMDVHYHGPREKAGTPYPYCADLVEMAGAVDFLAVTCSAGPETRRLIDARVLAALGTDGILVNVTRRAVDETALVSALAGGVIAGAGLDTFENEPQVPDELSAMENVVLQAHAGSKTRETKRAIAEATAGSLRAHFARSPLPSPVP